MLRAVRKSAGSALAWAAMTAALSGCGQSAAPATSLEPTTSSAQLSTTSKVAPRPPLPLEPKALLGLDALPRLDRPTNPTGELSEQALSLVLDAEGKIRQKDFAGAMALLNQASALEPQNPRILRDIGLAQAGTGQLEQAFKNLSSAVASAPDDLEAQLWVGRLAANQRDWDLAIHALRTALLCSGANPQEPKTAEALLRLGEALETQGYFQAALEALSRLDQWLYQNDLAYRENLALRATMLRPERLWAQLGLLELRLGRYEAAVAHLEQAHAMNLVSGPTSAVLVEALARSGQTQRAIDVLLALADEPSGRPQAAPLSHLLARIDSAEGRPVEALWMLAELIEDRPLVEWSTRQGVEQVLAAAPANDLLARFVSESGDDLERFSMRYVAGQLAAASGKPVTATAQFQGTIQVKDDFLPAYEALLDVASQSDDQQQLADAMARVEAMPNESHFRHFMLGKLAAGRNDLKVALAELQEAKQLDDTHVPTLLLLAQVQELAGQSESATVTLEEATEVAPDVPDVHAALYRLYVGADKFDKAQQAAERYIQADPSNLEGKVMLAELHILTRRYAKARQAIDDLRRLAPTDIRPTLLQLRLEMGRDVATMPADAFEQSLKALNDVIRREPQNQAARRMLAEALSKRGRPVEAAKAWGELYRQTGQANLQRMQLAALAQAKQYDEALAILQQRLAVDPADLWAQSSTIAILDKMGQEEKIAQLVAPWLAAAPDDQTRSAYRARLVLAYERTGQYDAIGRILDEIAGSATDEKIRQAIRVQKLRLYEQARQYAAAMAYVQGWIADHPDETVDAQALLMSMLLRARMDASQAMDARDLIAGWQAQAQPAQREPMRALELILLAKAKHVDEACDAALAWVATEPTNRSPRELVLLILDEAGRHKEALAIAESWLVDLEQQAQSSVSTQPATSAATTEPSTMAATGPATSLAQEPDDATTLLAWTHRQIVSLMIQAGESDAALSRVDQMLAGQPAETHLLQLKATALSELGRQEQSLAVLEAAWDANQSDVTLANNLAYGYATQGVKLDRAERILRKALADDPRQVAAVDSLAWVYYKQNRLEESAGLFRNMLDSGAMATQADIVMYDHAGDAFYRLGQQQLAKQMWQSASDVARERQPRSWDERRTMTNLPAKLEALTQGRPAPVAPLGGESPSTAPSATSRPLER